MTSLVAADVGFVLIHGGNTDSRVWAAVREKLHFAVLAPDLPGRAGVEPARPSLADHVEAIRDAVTNAPFTRIVLVAHSVFGVAALQSLTGLGGRVAHLVLVAAVAPRHGQSAAEASRSVAGPLIDWCARRLDAFRLPRWLADWLVCHDMDPASRGRYLDGLVPEPFAAPEASVWLARLNRPPESRRVPVTYVQTTRDRGLSPGRQARFARRVEGARLRPIDSGHAPMFSQPLRLAALLNDIGSQVAISPGGSR